MSAECRVENRRERMVQSRAALGIKSGQLMASLGQQVSDGKGKPASARHRPHRGVLASNTGPVMKAAALEQTPATYPYSVYFFMRRFWVSSYSLLRT